MSYSNRSSSFDVQTENNSFDIYIKGDLDEMKCENSQFDKKLDQQDDDFKNRKSVKKRLTRHLDRQKDLQLIKQLDLQSSEDESNKSIQSFAHSSNRALKNSILKARNEREIEIVNKPIDQEPSDLSLNLKSTLHHALESKYAYMSFQDSFNINDYQSFDSNKSSLKSTPIHSKNPKKLSNFKDSFSLKNLDSSFNTSLDLVSLKGKSLSPSKINNRSNQSTKDDVSAEDLNQKEVIDIEDKDVALNNNNSNNSDNYPYDGVSKRKFQFKNFVDVIRV